MKFRIAAFALASLPATGLAGNDYPTLDRVDHVLNCVMAHGGQLVENVYPCSCQMDYIAERMSYEEFVDARTVESFETTPGDKGGLFRDSEAGRNAKNKLKQLRAEADKHCFVTPKAVTRATVQPSAAAASPEQGAQ